MLFESFLEIKNRNQSRLYCIDICDDNENCRKRLDMVDSKVSFL